MPKIKLSIPHTLKPDEAKARLQHYFTDSLSEGLGEEITNINVSWAGFFADISFITNGHSIRVSLKVRMENIQLDGKIPMVALPLVSRIKKEIRTAGLQILQSPYNPDVQRDAVRDSDFSSNRL